MTLPEQNKIQFYPAVSISDAHYSLSLQRQKEDLPNEYQEE
jgi:hypothetical protein